MSDRIRLAFAVDSFRIGGTELNAARTAIRLDPERFELVVLCLREDGELREEYARANIPVYHFPIGSLLSMRTAREGVRLMQFLRDRQVQILHAHDVYTNCFAVPFARLAGVPTVIASRRFWHTVPRPALRHANRVAYRFAHRILANSPSVARLLTTEEGVSPSRVLTVPNFVEADAFDAPPADQLMALRSRLGLAGHDFAPVIGIVARLDPVKDHAALLRAAKVLIDRGRTFRLVIVGDGDQRGPLERLTSELGLGPSIHFAGQLSHRPNPHALFDVSVLCSTAEGFPNAILEAMAAGRPVVATRVGGIPDAVEEGRTGLLVAPGDVEGLAVALDGLLTDDARRTALGAAGRERAREMYGERSVLRTLEDAYLELAAKAR
jgi:glycosyltransferase involved in cell wall biosynthesis